MKKSWVFNFVFIGNLVCILSAFAVSAMAQDVADVKAMILKTDLLIQNKKASVGFYHQEAWSHWVKVGEKEVKDYESHIDPKENNQYDRLFTIDGHIVKIVEKEDAWDNRNSRCDTYFYENGKIAFVFKKDSLFDEAVLPKGVYATETEYYFDRNGKRLLFSSKAYNKANGKKVPADQLTTRHSENDYSYIDGEGTDYCSFPFLNPFFSVDAARYGCSCEDFFKENFTIFDHVKTIPAYTVDLFLKQKINKKLEMADPGQPFQAYDVITTPGLPWLRLIFAGDSPHFSFIYYQYGGEGPGTTLFVVKKTDKKTDFYWDTQTEGPIQNFGDLKKALRNPLKHEAYPHW